MSLRSVEYIPPVNYDQLWVDSERLKVGLPPVLRPVGPDGSVVGLTHETSSGTVYRAIREAGKPIFNSLQARTVAYNGLKAAQSYLESTDKMGDALAVKEVLDTMDTSHRQAIEDQLYDLNAKVGRRPDWWVVFRAGQIGLCYAGRLTGISAVGDRNEPVSLPLLAGADDVPGRLPDEACNISLYCASEATIDVATGRPLSQSV